VLERALAIQEAHYGADHVEVAATLGNLGNAYGALGDAAKQKALLERALVIQEADYGADHVKVAVTKFNLGKATGSLDMVSEAHAAFLAHYGPEHSHTQRALRLKAELG
jgi:hypothetical protein